MKRTMKSKSKGSRETSLLGSMSIPVALRRSTAALLPQEKMDPWFESLSASFSNFFPLRLGTPFLIIYSCHHGILKVMTRRTPATRLVSRE
jgi:hypothetical protein